MKTYEKRYAQITRELKEFEDFKAHPSTIFQGQYKEYDQNGFPTLTLEGKEISKGAKKKLETIFNKHSKNYQQIQLKLEKNPNFESELRDEQNILLRKIEQLNI